MIFDLSVGEMVGYLTTGVVAISAFVQISPIKINPWTWLAKKIGRAINGEVLNRVEALGEQVQYDYHEDLMRQTIVFQGPVLQQPDFPVATVAKKIVPHLEEIAAYPLEPQAGLHGILELILLLLISQKLRGDDPRV